jgi:hypothetical protein
MEKRCGGTKVSLTKKNLKKQLRKTVKSSFLQNMSATKQSLLSEDWSVVLLGFLIIAISLFGFILPVPVFSWKNTEELATKVFSVPNLGNTGLQFVFVLVIAVPGASLTGKPLKTFLIVFPVVYILTIIALIIAGNSNMKAINLEAVIFSLCIGLLIGNLFRLPQWFRNVLSTELFVKIGLVLLGTGVIFSDIRFDAGIDCSVIGMVFCFLALQKT